ncbi:kinase-like domain-containing protein [Lipomyces oligophaga]|uniref:kinase-like domain-containing protein n=1 Tax=Lipomyces oligophaga TaxID=45792 RepID=UPI0034CF1D01
MKSQTLSKSSQSTQTQLLATVDELESQKTQESEWYGILVMKANGRQKVIQLRPQNDFSVGRKEVCNEIVKQKVASAVHFVVYVIVFDHNQLPLVYCWDRSSNGTFVNNKIIGTNKRVLLTDGDEIEIRHVCSFTFHQRSASRNLDSALIKDFQHIPKYKLTRRTIGQGSFGQVLLAENRATGRQVACKIMDSGSNSQRMFKAKTEIALLQRLSHPNIIAVYDASIFGNRVYMFEELITGGDMFSYLTRDDRLSSISEAEALVVTFQLLQALLYLHENNIVHRDLKLDNILRVAKSPESRVVLADFGISKYTKGKPRMTTVVGTPEFCAPEVGFGSSKKTGNPGYDHKCDSWSLGVIIHIMLSGKTGAGIIDSTLTGKGISPFWDCTEDSTAMAIKAERCQVNMSEEIWSIVSWPAKDLIHKLLCTNVERRYSISDCFEHPWIKSEYSLLSAIYKERCISDWNQPDHRTAILSSSQCAALNIGSQ